MKYSICIDTLYKEEDFERRIDKAAEDGFSYVEFWTWQNRDIDKIKLAASDPRIRIAGFSGDDEYSMIYEDESAQYIEFLKRSILVAKNLCCDNLIIHSDAIMPDGSAKVRDIYLSPVEKEGNLKNLLSRISDIIESEEITLVLEPLNDIVDHKFYFLNSSEKAFEIIRDIGSNKIKVLFDIYHMQIMGGNILQTIERNLEFIGYIHIADVPGRHEPGTGELNYKNIIRQLGSMGFDGVIGFELEPLNSSQDAIKAIKEILI